MHDARDEHGRVGVTGQQLGHDGGDLARFLARGVDRLGQPLAQQPMVVDAGESEISVGQPTQLSDGVIGAHRTDAHRIQQLPKGGFVHVTILTVRDRLRRILDWPDRCRC